MLFTVQHNLNLKFEGFVSENLNCVYGFQVFKKHGVERFNPRDELFDPTHTAVFQIQDASKQPGRVAVVLKVGFIDSSHVALYIM